MNIFHIYKQKIMHSMISVAPSHNWDIDKISESFVNVAVEPPRDATHGDISTNVAMVLCKQMGMNPRQLAEMVVSELAQDTDIESVQIAGPGFINVVLKDTVWKQMVCHILSVGDAFGSSDMGNNQPVNIEYVSANPTGPLHIGHTRGAVYGDVLASIMDKVGYNITREYYINDAGAQVDVLARSAFLRYREACGENISIPEGLYPGDYLIPVGQKIKEQYGDSLLNAEESEWLADIRTLAVDSMMDVIRKDLERLRISHDVFTSEKALVDANLVEKAIESLGAQGLLYEGVLDPPKGKLSEDWEQRPQTLFKSSEFGDDVDRPLKKSDGSYTYFASDIANHYDKYRRGFTTQIDVMGADHGGYVKRMCSAVRAMSAGKATLDVELCQLVKLLENGDVVKMSKRAGNFITLSDLVDAVGADVVRFFMMMRKSDAPMDFDIKLVKKKSKDNPIFYIQYAHARCHSVLRTASEKGCGADLGNVEDITDPELLSIVKQLAIYPRILEQSALSREPHRLAFYLLDLASSFHELWAKGSGTETLRFIQENNNNGTNANLMIISAIQQVIRNALSVFSICATNVL